jgi:uncharacterized protein YaaN involved in tellurite resistance
MPQSDLDPLVQAAIRDKAAQFVADLTALDVRSPSFAQKVAQITTMGQAELRRSASMAGQQLDHAASIGQVQVSARLTQLRAIVAKLDPRDLDSGPGKRIFGSLLGKDRIGRYFDRYRAVQPDIDAIIRGLAAGQDALRKENAALETERVNQRTLSDKLNEYLALAEELDAALEQAIASDVATGRADSAEVLRNEALLPIRQRRQELLTQVAVSMQTFLALDIVHGNNVALIRGVHRAQTSTIAALRVAIAASAAMSGQQLVLDRIEALNAQALAAAAAPEPDLRALQVAFADVIASMDELDRVDAQRVRP